ncbi:MAG: ATP-binding cassette domain-containing protein [Rhodomicrobium sp.]|nr:ATP-binding cassette domain-containing protein [Rhodomicrobium sp.]
MSKTYPGGKQVLNNISLSFLPDAKIGVVGVNGSGKSTLLKIMAGVEKEFQGEAWAADGVKVGYLQQEPQLDPSKDVLGNAMDGVAEKKAMLDRYNELAMNYSDETADEMARLQDIIDGQNLWDLDAQVEQALQALNCPPPHTDVSKLSGGEKRRVALVQLLLSKPDILLLDEPTNHLDAETTDWLQHYLENYPGCVILVTHDRYFLDSITQWTLELDRGQGVPYKGNYSSWLEQKAKRAVQEKSEEEAKQRTMTRELEWIRSSPKARQAHIRRGEIYGLIGPNGAGKTTLFRMIVGQEKPDSGAIRLGDTVKLGYVDQSRDALDPKKSVWEEISGGLDQIKLGTREVNSRAYCGWFNFKGPDQQKKVGQLSGGERNRVHLAKMLKEGGNLILLDEPTNDLDVETLSSLEAALEHFPGCTVVISHDRFFLDRLATHILAFEGDGHVEWFEGNFQAYEEDKRRRLGDAALDTPKAKFARFARG